MCPFKVFLTLCLHALFVSNLSAETLEFLSDPIVASATADQCQISVIKNSNKINSLCNKNSAESEKIAKAGVVLDNKIPQIENSWLRKKDRINFSYSGRRDSFALRIAELNALRADILANCGGEERCTRRATSAANRITKLNSRAEVNAVKWTNALSKNDTRKSEQLIKAEESYSEKVAKAESNISSNNTDIDILNNAIVACNGIAVSCSGS